MKNINYEFVPVFLSIGKQAGFFAFSAGLQAQLDTVRKHPGLSFDALCA